MRAGGRAWELSGNTNCPSPRWDAAEVAHWAEYYCLHCCSLR